VGASGSWERISLGSVDVSCSVDVVCSFDVSVSDSRGGKNVLND
jgi:hypothetical protein